MSRFVAINVNTIVDRPGFVSCQITKPDTPIGGDCIEVWVANSDLLSELIDSTSEFASDLLKYGTHHSWCKYEIGADRCTCGFAAARDKAKETA